MKRYSIVCICQVYNELLKGNLKRFIKYTQPLIDHLVFYDDGSTDGSYEYMLEHTPHVIRGEQNDFANERLHKQMMLEKAISLSPDFILWLDADEVMTANASDRLQDICSYCEINNLDGILFLEINLWRSHSWQRIDSLYNTGWFNRLWKVKPNMAYDNIKPGLHQAAHPATMVWTSRIHDVKVIHYGFSSQKRLAYKYLIYKAHGQSGYDNLDRLISEEKLELLKVAKELFPEGLYIDDEKPVPISFQEALAYVEQFREEVLGPKSKEKERPKTNTNTTANATDPE